MKVTTIQSGVLETPADAAVVGIYADEALAGAAAAVDEATGGVVSRLIEQEEFHAKAGECATLWSVPGAASGLTLLVGLGPREKLDRQTVFRAAGAAAKQLAGKQRGKVAFFLGELPEAALHESGVLGAMAGCQGQDLHRAEKNLNPFDEILWAGDAEAATRAAVIGQAMSLTRRVVNEAPQDMYPESFADEASQVASACGLEIEIWDQAKLEAERCGSLLAVARGSARAPRLVILRHNGAKADSPTLALVGKGVTFDSGGLSLKPTASMATMKCDMAGAGTVLGAMQAIAQLKLPVNVIGLMGLVENMTGGAAMKLGDVLTARSGKTIEVLNTDAEGRLVLADVLNVAVDRGAAKIIDLATLTGACVVALGTDIVGAMTNNQDWLKTVMGAAQACGELVWQLPMFEFFNEQIKSDVADIKNIGAGRWGGAITAAKFLEEFVEGKPWVHLDIAGPAFADKPTNFIDAGASGAMVQTLVEVASGWK